MQSCRHMQPLLAVLVPTGSLMLLPHSYWGRRTAIGLLSDASAEHAKPGIARTYPKLLVQESAMMMYEAVLRDAVSVQGWSRMA
jgi:hypothetical protein